MSGSIQREAAGRVGGVGNLLKGLGATRLAAAGAVTLMLLGFFAIVGSRIAAPDMATLYADLSVEDSAAIVRDLEAQDIPFELKRDGTTILVAKDKVARLRIKLAEKSLPTGGSVGYEIFDKTETLGTTTFVQNIKHLRALEGELARTIRSIERVQSARVHLVIPERQLFQRDRKEPTASIALKVRGALEGAHIRAIQHLVASAVEGLKPARVAIVDEGGKLLASGADDSADALAGAGLDERRLGLEKRLEARVEEIVASVVGRGRARIKIAAELDQSRITQTADTFDPASQVVRSTQTKEEKSQTGLAERQVTVGAQLPGGAAEPAPGAAKDASATTEETINYEISKTTRTEVAEAGRLKRLSVAVLVDGVYSQAPGGEIGYQPRPQADLDQIAALVRSAVGYDEVRGDRVQIVNLRFAEAPVNTLPPAEPVAGLFDFGRDDIMRMAELGVLGFLTLVVLVFGVRPLLNRLKGAAGRDVVVAGGAGATRDKPGAASGEAVGALRPPETNPASAILSLPVPNGMIDPALIEQAKQIGHVHANSIKKMGDMIRDNPDEAAQVVRGWLNNAA